MIYLTGNLRSQSAKHFILLLGFVLLISFVQAQTGVVNNGAKMIVNSGAVLKITGAGADYTNATFGGKDGIIDLDGKIELHGDWTNNAVSGDVLINYTDGDGEVVFNGSVSQSISGIRASYFEKLTLNNTFGLSLDTNVQVVANLLLTNGIVTLNNDNLTMGVAGTITGGTFGTSRMILVNGTGSLVKSMNAAGSFTFPIGENTGTLEYSPVDFTLNGHAGAVNSWVSAHVTDAQHPSDNSPSEFLSRYWTLTSSGIDIPNYDADFHYLPADINGVEASIYSAEYDDGSTRYVHNTVDDALNIVSVSGLSTIENTFADYTGVDGTIPTVVITCGVTDPTNSDPIPFTATFSEEVSGFAYTDITIDNGSTLAVSTTDDIEFTFNVEPTTDGDVTIDIDAGVCTDIAENDNAAADQFSILYDGTQPNVNLTTIANDPTNLLPFTVKVQFTEKVNGFVEGDVSVTNGAAGNLVMLETDSVWTVDITPDGDGAVDVDINAGVADDAASNLNIAATTLSIDYDGTVPTVAISSSESTPTNSDPIPITITFSEAITGFALSDIVVGNGVAGDINTSDNTTYTVTIDPTGDGSVTVDIAANVAIDAAGNNNTIATQFSITYDGTSPGVTISSTAEPGPINGSFTVSIHFDEAVTGFIADDVTVSNCTKGTFTPNGNDQDWTLVINPSSDGAVTVDIAANVAIDAAGNNNTIADQFGITYDGTLPGVEITSTEPNPTNGSFSVSIHFDETVTGFIIDDIIVSNGTKGTFDGSGQDYTLDITPISNGSVTVDIAADVALDAAGNGNSIATQFSIIYDISNPTVAITSSEATLTNVNPIPITITFNEDVSGFITEDITVGNGIAGNLINTTPNQVWTAEIIPDGNGTVTVDINADVAQDDATNVNDAATQFSITYDGTSPGVTISSTESDPTNGSFSVSIHFDEAVTGFIIDDVTVSNCTKGAFAGTGQDYTLDINPTTDGLVTVDIAANVAIDAAGNNNTIADQFSITFDNADPTVLTYNPADEATGVALAANLGINFDEIVVAGTGNIDLYETGVGIVQSFDVATSGLISGFGTASITINPTLDLESFINYHIEIALEAFYDEAGNSYAGISNETTWNFKSVDSDDPYITGLSPIDNTIDVSLTSDLQITFSENVVKGTGDITIMNATDALTHETIDVTTGLVSITNNIVTINPGTDFNGEKEYYIVIDNTAFEDATSNAFAGISNPATWNFTTEDVAAPTIDALSPTDDATDVVINSDLEITFNENVVKGTGNIIITNESGPTVHETIDVTSGQVTISSNVLTINPDIDFNGESDYYVEFVSGVFVDESANDFAGISGATTWNYTTEDVSAPTVVVSTTESDPTNSTSFSVTITFNEEVQNFVLGDISVTNGTASTLDASSNPIFTVDIAPDADGTVSVVIPAGLAQDLAGNANEVSNQLNIEYDGTSPTVALSTLVDPTNLSPFILTIEFSEVVSGFDAGDINVGNGAAANIDASSNPIFTAEITPTGDGAVTIDVAADAATDPAGNGNTIASQLPVTYDSTSPSVVISTTENDPTKASLFEITIEFSEEVNGFEIGDITVDNCVASNLSTTDNIKFTADIAPIADGSVTVDIGVGIAQDDATNPNTVATQFSIEYDTQSPNVTIASTQVSPTNASPFEVTITFDEEVQSFTAGDISVTNGTAGNLLSGDNITYTADITPGGELTVLVSVPVGVAQDLAENGNLVSNEISVEYDITSPTVEITSVQSGTINTDLDLTITFNEAITDLLAGNITVPNGTVSSLTNTVAGTTWTATIGSITDGTVTVDILVDEVIDLAGNGNIVSNQFTIDYDGSAPLVDVLSPTDDSSNVAVSRNLYITFDEEVDQGAGFIKIYKVTGSEWVEDISVAVLTGFGTKTITIDPASDFESEVEYYVLIEAGAFTDLVGNDFAGISSTTYWTFTAADITEPSVDSKSPVDDAPNVLINSDLVITFTEDVIANVGDITIVNDDTGQDHEVIDVTTGQVVITPSNVVTISPSIAFIGQTNYHVIVTPSSFQDGSGNNFGGITDVAEWNFFTEDKNAPIATFSPNNVMGVSVASNLQITFDENVVANTGNIIIHDSNTDTIYETFAIGSVNIAGTVVTINPTSNFEGLTNYYVLIDDGALEDELGNAYGGITDPNEWYFTTADVFAPVYLSLTPADDAGNVSITSNLVINFNETVVAGSGNIDLYRTGVGIVESFDVVTSGLISGFGTASITINPTLELVGETDYYVLIDNGAFQDVEENDFGGISNADDWNFTTIDVTDPIRTGLSPIDGATDVSITSNLEITFNENIFKNTGNITIKNVTSGTTEIIDINSGEISISGSTLTINPSADFAGLTDYYVLIASTAIRDLSGNNYEGIADTTIWNFTTGNADIPNVTDLSPPDDYNGASITSDLIITFNEIVVANTGNITIYNATTSANHEVFDVNSTQVTIDANVVTINSTSDFDGLSDYYVLIADGAFQDIDANNYAGMQSSLDWNFTTADVSAPVVDVYTPLNGATDVSVTSNLVLDFNETVTANTGYITIYDSNTKAIYEQIDVANTGLVSVSSDIVTINPSINFVGDADYYVHVDNGAFQDTEGNDYGGIADAVTWNFTTEDKTNPTLVSRIPAHNATDIVINSNLIITFDEDIFVNVGNITIYDTDADTIYEQIILPSALVTTSSSTVTINPSIDFVEKMSYHVLIDPDVFIDANGNGFTGILGTTTWNFVVADITLPTIITLSPTDDATGVSVSSDLQITFSEPVVANTGLITINTASTTYSIDVTSTNIVDNVVTINPGTDFSELTDYYVLIDADAFHDESGNSFAGISDPANWNFTSGDDSQPSVVITSTETEPVNGNFEITVTFSESVTGFASSDITVTNGTVGTFTDSIPGLIWIAEIQPNTDGNVTIDIAAGVAQDASENDNTAAATYSIVYDATAPTVAITPTAKSVNVTGNFDITVTFSEPVTGFTIDDIAVGNASLGTLTVLTAGQIWTVTVVPVIDGDVTIDIAAGVVTDIAGNANTAAPTYTVGYDATAPTVAITASATGTVTGDFDITVTFSEFITGFTIDDITVSNATLGPFTESTPGLIWTVTIEPIANGDVTINIAAGAVTDIAGNDNTAASQFSIVFDDGVGFEDMIPYEILIYSIESRVIIDFTNEGNYQFKEGVIEIYNLLGQRIVTNKIDDFVKFETELDHVSQIYVVKVVIDGTPYTKRLYIK